jgi:hypothetical protein
LLAEADWAKAGFAVFSACGLRRPAARKQGLAGMAEGPWQELVVVAAHQGRVLLTTAHNARGVRQQLPDRPQALLGGALLAVSEGYIAQGRDQFMGLGQVDRLLLTRFPYVGRSREGDFPDTAV